MSKNYTPPKQFWVALGMFALGLAALSWVSTVKAEDDGMTYELPGRIVITPLIPGTPATDYTQPRIIYQPQGDGTVDVYQTIPGTPMRDPYAPRYRIERD